MDDVNDDIDNLSEDEKEFDFVFMKEYREKRIQEMTKNLPIPGKKIQSEPTSVSLLCSPTFGYIIDSGGDGWYIKEVEEEDSRVTVVIVFYEEDIHTCTILNKHLEEIATSWNHVKFVRILSSYCGVHLDSRTLPIISVYRNSQLLSVIKNIPDELMGRSGTFTKEDVEWLLESSEGWQTN